MGEDLGIFEAIGMLKTYVKASLVGLGAIKGAPCTIQSITTSGDTHTVTFSWEDSAGATHTSVLNVKDGAVGATGATGATGNGIVSIEKTSTVGLVDTYTITYTSGTTDTFTVTNGDFDPFTGASASANGAKGAVPAPLIADAEKLLCGDGTWTDELISEAQWTQIQAILT